MIFNSSVFLFLFFPFVAFFDNILPLKARNYFLLVVSLIFFSYSQPEYLWVLLFNILVNYIGALLISNISSSLKKTVSLSIVLCLNLGILFYFKYFVFLLTTINQLFHLSIGIKDIILPIGISFFTFQGMSYTIDVYREKVKVQKNFFCVFLYIVLFPQLIAGPIVRYSDIAYEIEARQRVEGDFYYGVYRFIIGLGKKNILANSLAVITDSVWINGFEQNTVAVAWIGSISYMLQIYLDFSGYSDMAIGLGRILGFHFPENFNSPYISKSITEFWRRWHISLSAWFRDYVYIPLGGNRQKIYRNLLIVFLLTGLWHGASWHLLAWGIFNVVFIFAERFLKNYLKGNLLNNRYKILTSIFLHIYTLVVVNLGWVFFRAESIGGAIRYIKTMFGIHLGTTPRYSVLWYLNYWNIFVIVIAILCSSSLPQTLYKKLKQHIAPIGIAIIENLFLLCVLVFSIIRVVSNTYNPFIYFQF